MYFNSLYFPSNAPLVELLTVRGLRVQADTVVIGQRKEKRSALRELHARSSDAQRSRTRRYPTETLKMINQALRRPKFFSRDFKHNLTERSK